MARLSSKPAESWVYVLKIDRDLPPAEQSRFTLSPLSLSERAAARDGLALVQYKDGARTIATRSRQLAIELAAAHIVSIENFPAGESKPWPAGEPLADRLAYLDLLGDDAVNELGNEIYDRSSLAAPKSPGTADTKNS